MANQVLISTGNLNFPYQVIDVVFALGSHTGGWIASANPEKAFDGVKSKLIAECLRLGGNAVINCQFEYRVAVAKGVVGNKQAVEIFAYGTAVRY